MNIESYGVVLEALSSDHLEMVRAWRNDPKISRFMLSQNHITEQMQKEWFAKLDIKLSPHFVIKYAGNYVGLCSAKRENFQQKYCETGMYIYEDDLSLALVPFRAALLLNDFCFEQLGVEQIKIYVLQDNTKALRFNRTLGYTEDELQPDARFVHMTLSKENHVKSKNKTVKFFR